MAVEPLGPAEPAGNSRSLGIIADFEPLITSSARRVSFYLTGSPALTEDLAQDVRCHLLRVLNPNVTAGPALIRRFITNALRDRIRSEKRRLRLASK